MSYRNPAQYVDTQSGQSVQRMQESLANTTVKTVQGLSNIYLENQRKIEEIAKEAKEATSEIENAVFQTKSKNSSIEFDPLNEKLNRYSDLKKQDPTKLTNKERNFMRSMENIGTTMKNGLANTTASAIAFKEQSDKGLSEDGGNDAFRNPEQYRVMSIMNGTIPGSKKASYEEDDMGNLVYSVKVYDGSGTFVGDVINGSIEKTMFVSKVPDLTKKKTDAIELVKAELSLDSKFSDAYARGDKFGPNKQGQKVEAQLFDDAIAAKADDIYREMSDNDLSSYWNNRIRPRKIIVTEENKSEFPNRKIGDEVKNNNVWGYDIELTQEQREEFKAAFILDIKGEIGAVRAQNKIMQTSKDAVQYKPNDFDKKTSQAAQSASILLKDIQESIESRTLPKNSVNFGQGTEEIVSTDFSQPAEEGGMGKVTIVTENKNKTKAGEVDQVSRTIDLNTKAGIKRYAKAVISGGSGSASEKEAKIKQLEKMLNQERKKSTNNASRFN